MIKDDFTSVFLKSLPYPDIYSYILNVIIHSNIHNVLKFKLAININLFFITLIPMPY